MKETLSVRDFLQQLRLAEEIHGANRSMDFHHADGQMNLEDWAAAGRITGWLEAQDLLDLSLPIERRAVARILHEYLRIVIKEADETSIQPASVLLDLYDCRSCVNHVAQMYIKGIMEAEPAPGRPEKQVFGMREGMNQIETETVILRLFLPKYRKSVERTADNLVNSQELKVEHKVDRCPKTIGLHEVRELIDQGEEILLIDIRSEAEFDRGHIEGAVNIPFIRLLENPKLLWDKREEQIVLYCDEGVRSRMAAESLLEAGIFNVFSITDTIDLRVLLMEKAK